ncbi:MAG: signal recognition particle-docking protein FtsY [Paracoccaceae bacterium]
MAFFSKLKERLFKSQKKLDEGLDALVEDGAEETPPAAPTPSGTPARTPADKPPPAAEPKAIETEAATEGAGAERPGFFSRMMGRSKKTRVLDDAMLEDLEDVLIQADLGVDTAVSLSARLSERHYGRRVDTDELKRLLAREIAEILGPVAKPLPIYAKRPQVVLVVGVNGSGKTTTIGKLASQLTGAGKRVVIAAGDTFRAAADEQLQIWGERAGVPVMTAAQGSDPASLAYTAFEKAAAEGADLLLIDTAGRLQNRQDLMEELAKIVRVLRRLDAEAPHNTVLVLDATTGQNALTQVETFAKIADVSGLVMTKLDGTAKGGVLVALADRFGLPIHAIGVGESIDDLAPFDPEDFASAITGAERT